MWRNAISLSGNGMVGATGNPGSTNALRAHGEHPRPDKDEQSMQRCGDHLRIGLPLLRVQKDNNTRDHVRSADDSKRDRRAPEHAEQYLLDVRHEDLILGFFYPLCRAGRRKVISAHDELPLLLNSLTRTTQASNGTVARLSVSKDLKRDENNPTWQRHHDFHPRN
jgi:hypothetical protein